ncbi:MAG TPA: polysaccharide deacetylase family protein [Solirubrobacteraceae bacterium]|nr:polysaccharide deacetylase family protein [Solirubrobacteraceae bacterium]
MSAFSPRSAGSAPLVLCYHAISPRWSAGLSVTPEAFERQVTNLVRDGWSAVTFAEAVRQPPSTKTMAITFDDAFASVKTYAQPVLSKLGVNATVFAPTDYVSRQAPLAWAGLDQWENGPDTDELTPMSWEDLAELASLGWEIGSHSRTHPRLTALGDDALVRELEGSRDECAARIGGPVTSIAYPYGDVDHRVAAHTEQAGYQAGAALEWPSARLSRYRYPRIGVYRQDTWPRFRLKIGRWSRSPFAARFIARRSANVHRS